VAEAYRKGIPVIILDRRVLGSEYTTFIGADNKKIGRAADNGLPRDFRRVGKSSNSRD